MTHDRDFIVSLVKALGQDVIDHADDIVGSGDMLKDLSIWLRIDDSAVPSIDVDRGHYSPSATALLINNATRAYSASTINKE